MKLELHITHGAVLKDITFLSSPHISCCILWHLLCEVEYTCFQLNKEYLSCCSIHVCLEYLFLHRKLCPASDMEPFFE